MGVQIKTPNITAGNDRERLMQIQSYLYQMAQQLQWAFDTIDTGGTTTGTPVSRNTVGSKSEGSKTPAENFAAIKSLIIKSADIVNAYYDQISKRLEGIYVAQSDFGAFAEQTALDLKANSQGITQNYTDIQQVQMNVSYLESSVGSVQTDIGNLQTWADSTQTDIYFLESDVSDLQGNIGKAKGDISGLQDNVEKTQSDISGLKDSVGKAQGDISGIQDNVGKVQNDVSNLQGNMDGLDDRVNSTNERVDGIQQNLNDLQTAMIQTNAYIKSGKIDEKNGIPIYGLEIGQSNSVGGQTVFDKFARFTADRLSFYDRNDIEVAYISDYHLHITNASISGTLTLMDQFEISCDSASVDFNWMGG